MKQKSGALKIFIISGILPLLLSLLFVVFLINLKYNPVFIGIFLIYLLVWPLVWSKKLGLPVPIIQYQQEQPAHTAKSLVYGLLSGGVILGCIVAGAWFFAPTINKFSGQCAGGLFEKTSLKPYFVWLAVYVCLINSLLGAWLSHALADAGLFIVFYRIIM